jgi:hypothetical protein
MLKRLQGVMASGAGPWDCVWDGHHPHDFRSSAPLLFCFLLYFSPWNDSKTHFNIFIYLLW